MAIGDDFSIATNGDIVHTSGTTNYTVLELHRWLQDLADDQEATGNDIMDITVWTPSERATDNIITLLDYSGSGGPTFNINDTAAQFLYDGSITQKGGAERYSGLVVVGSVESGTNIQVIQDAGLLTNYWGEGYNADAGANILLRIMVKTRVDNVTIDGGRVLVRAAEFGDTYAEFSATLGLGNNTAALFTGSDLNNQTASGTVATYDQFTETEGYQLIDIDNDTTDEEYYQSWDIGGGATPSSPTQADLYEWTKYVGRRGTAETLHGLNGELFRGITGEFVYDNETGTAPATNDEYAWGLHVPYDNETGTFTVGEAVWFNGSSAIRGRIIALDDDGTTGTLVVAMEAGTPLDDHTIAGQASSATADVFGSPTGEATGGGRIRVLAIDDNGTTGDIYFQLMTGTNPADNYVLWHSTDVARSIDVQGSVTSRTISPEFLGTYTGSNIIGSYGMALDTTDTVVGDVYSPLGGGTANPPNNVTFSVGGLVSGEDRVLVTNEDGSGGLDYTQYTLQNALNTTGITEIVLNTTIDPDLPSTGTVRVQLDSGIYHYQAYTSVGSTSFTIANTTFYDANNASTANNVFVSYIDKLSASATESFTVVYSSDRTMFLRVRDGGTAGDAEGIKTFETSSVLANTGGGTNAIRTPDV